MYFQRIEAFISQILSIYIRISFCLHLRANSNSELRVGQNIYGNEKSFVHFICAISGK